jgi:hypothetical protein
MTVAVGIVHDDRIDAKFVQCLLHLKESHDDVRNVIWVEGGPGNFDVHRNTVAAYFLEKTECEWLLTVDTDIIFRPDNLDQLLAHDIPVVSGLYLVNDRPIRPNGSRRNADGHLKSLTADDLDGLIEVDALGAGFMLVHRDVFTKVGEQDGIRGGPWYRQDALGANGWTLEPDYAFCQRVQQAGFPVSLDTDAFVGHVKPKILGYQL